jgi:hypothetical protein
LGIFDQEDAPRDGNGDGVDADNRLLFTVVLVDLKASANKEEDENTKGRLLQAKNASEQYARVLQFMRIQDEKRREEKTTMMY